MKILVLNSGSSSLKFQVFEGEKPIIKGHVDGIGLPTCKVKHSAFGHEIDKKIPIKTHGEAVRHAIEFIGTVCPVSDIKAVGHRVVHGGEKYKDAVKINMEVISTIDRLSSLAPLHNPPNVKGIIACQHILHSVPQVAVFDTAFHQTIPQKAYLYGLPIEYYKKYGIRKYGFHGTSHKYIMLQANRILKKKRSNLITCHLGNGSSICAIKDNKSVDTTMGFTPLQGLMMGTRSGDIDPAIVAFLSEKEKISAEDVVKILNKKSGLLGVSGYSDIRTIHDHAVKGDKRCELGLSMFAYHVVEYIGSYLAVLGHSEAIVFTAGAGTGAWFLRDIICRQLSGLGVEIDRKVNKKNDETLISAKNSKIKVLVIPTNEELMIANETRRVLKM